MSDLSERLGLSMASALAVSGGAKRSDGQSLPIKSIRPSQTQPRVYFDEAALDRLAADIAERGVLQPLLVRPVENGYELIDGARRWRAAQRTKLTHVPVLIRAMTAEQARLAALSAALNREDLLPIEAAQLKLSLAALALGIDDLDEARVELGRLSRPTADPARVAELDALFAKWGGETLRSFAKSSLPLLGYPAELKEAMLRGLSRTKARMIKNAPEELRAQLLEMAQNGASLAELMAVVSTVRPPRQSPEASRVKAIGRFLSSRQSSKLTPEQTEALTKWLADAPGFLAGDS